MANDRIDYQAAARGLVESLVIKLRLAPEIEGWLELLKSLAANGDEVARSEHQLLSEGWKQEKANRRRRGVCVDCDYDYPHHDPECPRYRDAVEAEKGGEARD